MTIFNENILVTWFFQFLLFKPEVNVDPLSHVFYLSGLDISADLATLGHTPVAVVCAGVKSILDIGRTLEYLETQGVPVLTVGQDKTFPAFFTPDSGHRAPYNVTTPLQAAEVIGKGLPPPSLPPSLPPLPPSLPPSL